MIFPISDRENQNASPSGSMPTANTRIMIFLLRDLNVLFKQETKLTIKQYVNNYRLEKSMAMLEKDFYKVTEIAELCGYDNANYFAREKQGGHECADLLSGTINIFLQLLKQCTEPILNLFRRL